VNAKFLLSGNLLLCASLILTINASNDIQLQKQAKAIKTSKIAVFKRKKEKILNEISPILCKIGAPGMGQRDFSHIEKLKDHRNSVDRQLKSLLITRDRRKNFMIERDKLVIKFDGYKNSVIQASSDFLKVKRMYIASVNQLPSAYEKLNALHDTVNRLNTDGDKLIKKFKLLDKGIEFDVSSEGCLLIAVLFCGLFISYHRVFEWYSNID
jgi:hypothetical protein